MRIGKLFFSIASIFYLFGNAWGTVICQEEIFLARKNSHAADGGSKAWDCIDEVVNRINHGDDDAISDGVKILKISDAGFTTSIKIALSNALLSNAKSVLENTRNDKKLLKYICSMNFIEPEDNFLKSYYKSAVVVINEINYARNFDGADECLGWMEKAYFEYKLKNQ